MTLADLQKRITTDTKLTVHFLGTSGKFLAALTRKGERIGTGLADDLEGAVTGALTAAPTEPATP